ncbi:hypothetical protein MK489_15500 [Myxococcota bacterium]|nr:hypothetical protein [Myxococcota bacterium]
MSSVESALVDIVREFTSAHQLIQVLFDRYREGTLRFSELEELIGDDERSVLFRLKEHCHNLFRSGEELGASDYRGALLDLAVGSLFHEAMSFRENFYQSEIYGPRMRALRAEAETGPEAAALIGEFERILASVSGRLLAGLLEVEALLERTRDQLGVLLAARGESGHLARYLIENEGAVAEVFPQGLDALLASIYGTPVEGFSAAARSYARGGYYSEVDAMVKEVQGRGAGGEQLDRVSAYAAAMTAYLSGDYGASVAGLRQWAEVPDQSNEKTLSKVAVSVLASIGKVADLEQDASVVEDSRALLARLQGTSKGAT